MSEQVRFFNAEQQIFVPKEFCIDFTKQLKIYGFNKPEAVKDLSDFVNDVKTGFSEMDPTDEAQEWFYQNYSSGLFNFI